jgi:hypothetical protein
MNFSDFIEKLKVKDHLTGFIEIEDHKLNFAKMFFLNKLTKFNKSSGARQTGRSMHNSLLALYNRIYKRESSLIVVFNTSDKQRLVEELESFTRQLTLPIQIDHTHDNISILSLNAWKDQKNMLSKKYDHIFLDNEIVDQYHDFLNGNSHAAGVDFFIDLCIDFSKMIVQLQNRNPIKSMNCLSKLDDKTIITSDGTEFKTGDLFIITANNTSATVIGTLININYDESINWASTIDVLFDNNIVKMPAHNIEYFTKV